MHRIQAILDKYDARDAQAFNDTIDMLLSKGVANGVYQDFGILCDLTAILGTCESIIKEKNKN
jgi:hypothetical protein